VQLRPAYIQGNEHIAVAEIQQDKEEAGNSKQRVQLSQQLGALQRPQEIRQQVVEQKPLQGERGNQYAEELLSNNLNNIRPSVEVNVNNPFLPNQEEKPVNKIDFVSVSMFTEFKTKVEKHIKDYTDKIDLCFIKIEENNRNNGNKVSTITTEMSSIKRSLQDTQKKVIHLMSNQPTNKKSKIKSNVSSVFDEMEIREDEELLDAFGDEIDILESEEPIPTKKKTIKKKKI
jgi:hypothetical protein